MSDLADLFPGFATHWVDTNAGRFFVRAHGEGPPLLLLHGYPQTHVEWHKIAPQLATRFSVVLMDLRGYGWSFAPRSEKGEAYTKRLMARDAIEVMGKLGHIRFSIVAHDRGARAAYRLALDHPERLDKLALIDIMPTAARWQGLNATEALKAYHWMFLAQPEPLPERLIGAAAEFYVDYTLASWTAAKDLSAFDPRALAHYRAALNEPSRIHATCEDYRAGATIDRADDEADQVAGKKVFASLLVLWGQRGIGGGDASTLDIWRGWAGKVEGQAIAGGHFLPEENPKATLEALMGFL